ncbi:MAG: diguanylate cyclase [Nitrospirota bacterium]
MVGYKGDKWGGYLEDKELYKHLKSLEIEAAKEIVDEVFAIIDGLEVAVYVADMQTYEILYVNNYIEKHFGKDLTGKKCYQALHDEDKPCGFCTNDRLLVDGKAGMPLIWDYHNKKTGLWYQYIDRAIKWPDGRLVRMQVAVDITDRKKTEIAFRRSEKFLNMIFDSINDPFNIIDCEYRIIKANNSYAQMRGKNPEQLIGRRCYEVLYNRKSICEGCLVKETFETGKPQTKEKLVKFNDSSHEIWLEIYSYPIFDEIGQVFNVIEYTRDITQRKKAEGERDALIDKLQHLYSIDDLTGLLNRRALIEEMEKEVHRAERYNSKLAMIICDIDYFKGINDTYGHDIGDEVLKGVSHLIKESMRNIDIIGRYGGDEFILILPQTSLDGAKEIAERVRLSVEKFEMPVEEDIVKTTLSIGVAEFNPAREDIEGLIKRADNALYMAKDKGRNRVYLVENSL